VNYVGVFLNSAVGIVLALTLILNRRIAGWLFSNIFCRKQQDTFPVRVYRGDVRLLKGSAIGRIHGAIVAATVAPTGCGDDRPVYTLCKNDFPRLYRPARSF